MILTYSEINFGAFRSNILNSLVKEKHFQIPFLLYISREKSLRKVCVVSWQLYLFTVEYHKVYPPNPRVLPIQGQPVKGVYTPCAVPLLDATTDFKSIDVFTYFLGFLTYRCQKSFLGIWYICVCRNLFYITTQDNILLNF